MPRKLARRTPFDVLIVGGGPAGAAAAVYAARKGIRTGVVAERFGGQTLDTLGIENFISVLETEGPKFAAALEAHVRAYDVDIMNRPARRGAGAGGDAGRPDRRCTLANGAALQGRTVILSTGARWRNVNVPGEAEYRNKGVAYCPHCDGPLFKGKQRRGDRRRQLRRRGGHRPGRRRRACHADRVRRTSCKADAVLVSKLQSLPNVTRAHATRRPPRSPATARRSTACATRTAPTGAEHDGRTGRRVRADRPGAQHRVAEGHGRAVAATARSWSTRAARPALPGVFAAGDATTVPYKQIVIAAGEGAKAALAAFDHLIRTPAA